MNEYNANIQGFELTVTTADVEVKNNVDQLVEFIKERVKDYTPEKYEGNADKAKKDRTELNKGIEQVKSVRQAIQGLNPYGEVIDRLASAEKLIKKSSDALGDIVKAKEDEEKDAKLKVIQADWDSRKFVLFPLEKVLNPKWLNKTYKLNDIQNEINIIIERTYRDIKLLEEKENADLLKARYLTDLDLSATLKYASELEANKENADKEKETRAEREHEEQIARQKKEVFEENDRIANKSVASSLASEVLGEEPLPELEEYTITVKVTESQLVGIKSFITSHGIEYECNKLEF